MQNNDLIGKLVLSKAGRDKNHFYIVIGQMDDKYVFLANGSTKTVRKPKKKKIMHIKFFDNINDEIRLSILDDNKSTDLQIKKFLKQEGIVKEG